MNTHKEITISFLPSDSDLWDFIEKKKETCNLSEYIRSLIRKDMLMLYNTSAHADEIVIERILQLLSTDTAVVSNENKRVPEQNHVSEEMIYTINNLFLRLFSHRLLLF